MLAMIYRGPLRVRIEHKLMPEILYRRDAIVPVTRSCICGSDLHLYNGDVPDTRTGMIFGHEFSGVVEEVGDGVEELKVGDLGLPGHELPSTPTPRNSPSCLRNEGTKRRSGRTRTRERTQPS